MVPTRGKPWIITGRAKGQSRPQTGCEAALAGQIGYRGTLGSSRVIRVMLELDKIRSDPRFETAAHDDPNDP